MSSRDEALARAFAEPVVGPSYRAPTRVLALAIVVGLLLWGGTAALRHAAELQLSHWVAIAAIVAVLLWPMPGILFGRTVVDADGVRQLGFAGREVKWAEVQKAKFVHLPGAPRLVLATGFGRVKTFQSGSVALDHAFSRVAQLVTALATSR